MWWPGLAFVMPARVVLFRIADFARHAKPVISLIPLNLCSFASLMNADRRRRSRRRSERRSGSGFESEGGRIGTSRDLARDFLPNWRCPADRPGAPFRSRPDLENLFLRWTAPPSPVARCCDLKRAVSTRARPRNVEALAVPPRTPASPAGVNLRRKDTGESGGRIRRDCSGVSGSEQSKISKAR